MHWSGWGPPGNSCRQRPGGQPAGAWKAGRVGSMVAASDAAQARPLTWKTVVKRTLAIAVAGTALYLVLSELIALLTVPGLTRGTAGPRRCGRWPLPTGCLAAAGGRVAAS